MSRRPPLPPPAMHFDRIPKPKRPMPALVAQDSKVIKPGKLVQSKSSAFRKKRELDTKLKTYGELPKAYGRSGTKRVKKDLFPEETIITAVEKKSRNKAAKRVRSKNTVQDRNARMADELRAFHPRGQDVMTAQEVKDMRNGILAPFDRLADYRWVQRNPVQRAVFDGSQQLELSTAAMRDIDTIRATGKTPVRYHSSTRNYRRPDWYRHGRERRLKALGL